MQFTVCENTGFHLRLGLIGPSGSGKTYTALKVATELGHEKIGIVDTENRSARRYARAFPRRFMALELSHFSPKDYIEALQAAEQAGIEVLVIDSLSHAWMGKGGVLEMVDESARRQSRGGAQNSFSGWRQVTPEHNRLVDALVHAKMHLIVTMRVKTEYVVEKDAQGKSVPRKVGLAPVQRDGLEYEFDIVGDLSPEHELAIGKSRCPLLADALIAKPGAELARTLRTWLDGTVQDEEAQSSQETPRHGDSGSELAVLGPWLKKLARVQAEGLRTELDAIRAELAAAFPMARRTKLQGECLRSAIKEAKQAIEQRELAAAEQVVAHDDYVQPDPEVVAEGELARTWRARQVAGEDHHGPRDAVLAEYGS